jgi:hypothetical protein
VSRSQLVAELRLHLLLDLLQVLVVLVLPQASPVFLARQASLVGAAPLLVSLLLETFLLRVSPETPNFRRASPLAAPRLLDSTRLPGDERRTSGFTLAHQRKVVQPGSRRSSSPRLSPWDGTVMLGF